MAEQLALDERRGQGGAVDRDQRTGASAAGVDRRHEPLLANAGLALDQDRQAGGERGDRAADRELERRVQRDERRAEIDRRHVGRRRGGGELPEPPGRVPGLDQIAVGELVARDPLAVDQRSVLRSEILDEPAPEASPEYGVAGRGPRIVAGERPAAAGRRRSGGARQHDLGGAGQRPPARRFGRPVAGERAHEVRMHRQIRGRRRVIGGPGPAIRAHRHIVPVPRCRR